MPRRLRSKRSGSRRGWRAERGGCGVTTSGPLTKARQLIALAASDSKEEARTAAFQACRLIREHGFEVVEKSAPRPFRATPPDQDINSVMRDIFEQELRRREQEVMAEMFRKAASEAARASPKKARGTEPKAKVMGVVMRNNRMGVGKRCQHCGERTEFPAFTSIEGDFYHPECVERTGCA
jgi:hypothetical protein